jgi:hypothetical protein
LFYKKTAPSGGAVFLLVLLASKAGFACKQNLDKMVS